MNDVVRKAILFGIGAAYYSKERIEAFVSELQKDGGLNEAEGKKMVDEILGQADSFRREQEKQIKATVASVIDSLGVSVKVTRKKTARKKAKPAAKGAKKTARSSRAKK